MLLGMSYEEIPAQSVASAEAMLLTRPSDEEFSKALLGVGLHEMNRKAAEQFCRWHVRYGGGVTCRSALLALAHLARRFGDCDGQTWILVTSLRDDPRFVGLWSDVADDVHQFVQKPPTWIKPVLSLDGSKVNGLADFWSQVDTILEPGVFWGRNLDAFNDILRGGFGTPEDGFVLRWKEVGHCRSTLGHAETARWLEQMLEQCHPTDRTSVTQRLERARAGDGDTLFEILVHIIRKHGPGGSEHLDFVDLDLAD